jgi:coenzyme F420 hydrogenase subunit beta
MTITLANGEKKTVDQFNPCYWGRTFQNHFFTKRCFLCADKVCRLSDISFGDAWGVSDSKIGESLIVSRNSLSEALLSKAVVKQAVTLQRVDETTVIASQSLAAVYRKHNARMGLYKKMRKPVPDYNQPAYKTGVVDYADALCAHLKYSVSSNKQLKPLLTVYPFFRKKR